MCNFNKKINFIKKAFPKDEIYSIWLNMITRMESYTISDDIEKARNASMDLMYMLFPLIDSISLNLFGKQNGRYYLRQLGYSKKVSDMVYSIFRNGIMHNISPYKPEYKNRVVSWGIMTSSGSSGFHPYYRGYVDTIDSNYNLPAEQSPIEYIKDGKNFFHLSFSIDRLIAQIRDDLEVRQKNDESKNIDFVVGFKEESNIP